MHEHKAGFGAEGQWHFDPVLGVTVKVFSGFDVQENPAIARIPGSGVRAPVWKPRLAKHCVLKGYILRRGGTDFFSCANETHLD
jgi:hypothetical protein